MQKTPLVVRGSHARQTSTTTANGWSQPNCSHGDRRAARPRSGGEDRHQVCKARRQAKLKSRELTAVNSTASGGPAVAGLPAMLATREGALVRGGFGGRRLAAGEGVVDLEAADLEVEPGVEGAGQRRERSERQVLPAAEDLADPARRDAHPGREVRPGDAALAHVEGDPVGQLRDQTVHLLVNLSLHGPLVWRNA